MRPVHAFRSGVWAVGFQAVDGRRSAASRPTPHVGNAAPTVPPRRQAQASRRERRSGKDRRSRSPALRRCHRRRQRPARSQTPTQSGHRRTKHCGRYRQKGKPAQGPSASCDEGATAGPAHLDCAKDSFRPHSKSANRTLLQAGHTLRFRRAKARQIALPAIARATAARWQFVPAAVLC